MKKFTNRIKVLKNRTMTSSETHEDLQFGNIKPQNQLKVLPDPVPPQKNPDMLSFRRSGLKQVPDTVLDRGILTYLCLEGNQISSLPGSVFLVLPSLQWLDLRDNQVLSLPAEIGSHRCLETLLLGGNPLSELPAELGKVCSLRGLDLRDCPVRFPPQEVLQQGCGAVLSFLRSVLAQCPVSATKTLTAGVEKLQLSQLMESEDEDGEGLQRFWELRDKLVPLEWAELDSTTQEDKTLKPLLRSVTRRTKTNVQTGGCPQSLDWKKAAGRLEACGKELRDKRAQLDQSRMRVRKSPQKECAHTRPALETHLKRTRGGQRCPQDDPNGTRTNLQEQIVGFMTGSEEDRSAWELQRHIRTCFERLQERRRNPGGSGSTAEEEDVDQARRSQARLLERRGSENCFTIFTADSWGRFPPTT